MSHLPWSDPDSTPIDDLRKAVPCPFCSEKYDDGRTVFHLDGACQAGGANAGG